MQFTTLALMMYFIMTNRSINIREAKREDVAAIVRLLADDDLGSKRELYEDPLSLQYYSAFDEIKSDNNAHLIVAEVNGKVIGTLQFNFISYLTYQGGRRAQIESVRVDSSYKRQGIGRMMLEYAILKAKENRCHLVQLTTNKERPSALEFYKTLGFVPSHEGLKLHLR